MPGFRTLPIWFATLLFATAFETSAGSMNRPRVRRIDSGGCSK